MKKIILYISLLITTVSFARNDTIYLCEKHIEFNGRNFNLIQNEEKKGKWIEYSLEDNTIIVRLGSGDNAHWHDNIYTEYRHLKQNEYSGIEILTSQKSVGTVDGDTIYQGNYTRVENKIPSSKYYISGKGNYKKNKKEGKWIYFHKNGTLKKEIHYKNGLPKKGFKLYRQDGQVMIEVRKINNEDWEITKYSELGIKLVRNIKKTNEIKPLY